MSKLTKADIVDSIYNRISMDRREIRDVVDLFIGEIKSALVSRKVIELRGFGTFEIKERKRVRARNPQTGEILSVTPHGIASFRAGRELRREVWNLPGQGISDVEPAQNVPGQGIIESNERT